MTNDYKKAYELIGWKLLGTAVNAHEDDVDEPEENLEGLRKAIDLFDEVAEKYDLPKHDEAYKDRRGR